MHPLAEKLMGRDKPEAASSFSNILFGAGLSLPVLAARPSFRVGFWPIQSQDSPETAMGLASVLALLLERWPSIHVYRLFTQVDDGEPASFEWSIAQSQFGVDDWELDGLDENVAIWGNLEQRQDQWVLQLEVENDLSDDEEPQSFTVETSSLEALVNSMLSLSADIADYLDAGERAVFFPDYQLDASDENPLKAFLASLFHWDVHSMLALWGKPWDDIAADHQDLIEKGVSLKSSFGAWAVSAATGKAILYPFGQPLLSRIEETAEAFDDSATAAIGLALAVFSIEPPRAYNLLEGVLEEQDEVPEAWLALAELYIAGNEVTTAIYTLQRAIALDAVLPQTYVRYAETLLFLDANNLILNVGARHRTVRGEAFQEEYVLLPEAERDQDQLLNREAVAALLAARDMTPDAVEIQSQLVMQLIDLGEDEVLWPTFTRLVEFDQTGEYVRGTVDAWYNLEEVAPGLQILEQASAQHPDRQDLHMNLAVAYLAAEDYEAAEQQLLRVRQSNTDPQLEAEIQRLLLSVDDPDFEARLGEITDIVNAGGAPGSEDAEFLEAALEKAPALPSLYVLLGSAYLSWDDTDAALETLLDGQKQLPTNPDILFTLGRALWTVGEEDLAFEYLNKGLEANPGHVPLLVLTGRYLFDGGQEEEAKEFLARAEAIDPRNPLLSETRVYIARQLTDADD
jgi:tetratricopeptide (TPR) repeat protein